MANGIVVGGSLNRRSSASEGSQAYGSYADGAYITISDYNTDWYKTTFTYNGVSTTGYVKKAYVVMVNDTVKVRKNDVKVRSGAGQNFSEQYRVNSGDSGKITEIAKNSSDGYGWIKANYGSGVGWVRGDMFNKSASGGSSGGTGGTSSGGTVTYTGAKTIGNATLYEYNNPYDPTFTLGHTISGTVTVTDMTDPQWMMYKSGSEMFKVYRKKIDISYAGASANTVLGTSTLSSGSSGKNVYNLQHYLNRYLAQRGYAQITVDGSFGATTKQKVESFQQWYNSNMGGNLSVDGVVGPATREALVNYVNGLN